MKTGQRTAGARDELRSDTVAMNVIRFENVDVRLSVVMTLPMISLNSRRHKLYSYVSSERLYLGVMTPSKVEWSSFNVNTLPLNKIRIGLFHLVITARIL